MPPSDESFKQRMEQLVESPWTLWWINYFGAVAGLIAAVHPAGFVSGSQSRLAFHTSWQITGKGNPLLRLQIALIGRVDHASFQTEIDRIAKVGKKKRWIGGREGVGHRVEVDLQLE